MKINFVKLGVNLALFGLKIQGRVPTRYRDNEKKNNPIPKIKTRS